MDPSADFKSANLPNVRRLTIAHNAAEGTLGQIYDSMLPPLTHLLLFSLCVTDLQHLLPLSTSLQSLSIIFENYNEGLVNVLDQLSRMDVKKLRLCHLVQRQTSDNWETDFDLMEEFKRLVERKEAFIPVKLNFAFKYRARPSEIVSAQALARWKGIKGEFESICVKKGIAVERLECSLSHFREYIWIA
jgi:hypothetical protein